MSAYKVFNGTNWISIDSCNFHVRDVDNTWRNIDTQNCVVKYWTGASWCNAVPDTGGDFVMRINTSGAAAYQTDLGAYQQEQFVLPCYGTGYNFTVDWGDNVTEGYTGSPGLIYHNYPAPGEYIVTVSGVFPRVMYGNPLTFQSITKPGNIQVAYGFMIEETINYGSVGWDNMTHAFLGASYQTINPACKGDFSLVSDFAFAWYSNTYLTLFPAFDFPSGQIFDSAWYGVGYNLYQIDSTLTFATRNFYNLASGDQIFTDSAVSVEDYSDILVTQRANNNNTGVLFTSVSLNGLPQYNIAGGIAREELISQQNWIITDNGPL